MNTAHDALRHLVAGLAYRAAAALRDCPASFAEFVAGEGAKSPHELVTHLRGLLAMVAAHLAGDQPVRPEPASWADEVAALGPALRRVDELLAAGAVPTSVSLEQLLHGPLSDALHHVGQLALLRRLAGCPMPATHYFRAEVVTGEIAAV